MRFQLWLKYNQHTFWNTTKFDVAETDGDLSIFMPDATVKLMPQPEALLVSIDSPLEDLSTLEKVVLDHLSRMAQQEFTATWQHP